jgi:NADH dehydrogenase FAD-containing subunit
MLVVIIGAGECGVRAAFSLRERGFEGQVTLIGTEASLPYERPPLSKDVTAAPKAIRNLDAYLSAGIDLCLGQTAERILPGARQIIAGGRAHSYDRLLIATGTRARQVPAFADCLTLRTDRDAAEIMASLAAGKKVGIIGAGFIGLELASTARSLGADVTVFQNGPQVLARAVPAQIGELVAARHRAEGVALRMDADVVAADRTSVSLAGARASPSIPSSPGSALRPMSSLPQKPVLMSPMVSSWMEISAARRQMSLPLATAAAFPFRADGSGWKAGRPRKIRVTMSLPRCWGTGRFMPNCGGSDRISMI